MMHTKKNLTGIKGLSEAMVDKICEAAKKLVNSDYITGSDVLLKVHWRIPLVDFESWKTILERSEKSSGTIVYSFVGCAAIFFL
ncbi:hypothetical protein TSUD_79020 [Trifolium subterraneum]|uniref:Uncharacterized protein n=1 Tax=Trifolium subterraneum TaxID=3900 RepID=A0A2Z6LSC4_TRISU|nr:hypothetical protein TSUD_79020 [Trifolium subterraneum]